MICGRETKRRTKESRSVRGQIVTNEALCVNVQKHSNGYQMFPPCTPFESTPPHPHLSEISLPLTGSTVVLHRRLMRSVIVVTPESFFCLFMAFTLALN